MSPWYMHVAVAAGMAAVDFAYAEYTRYVADKNAAVSSHWAAIMFGLLGFVTTSYTRDPTLVAGGMLGAWAGTYISVRRHK